MAGNKKKPKKSRSGGAELALRVEEVLRIRLDGAQLHDVVQFASEKGWGVSDRQVSTYIQKADALLVERQDKSRKQVIARHLAQRQSLFARCVNAADYRTALSVLDSDAKLRGLYPEKDVRDLVKLAAAQGARIEELERRLRDAHLTRTSPPPAGAAGEAPGPPGGGAAGAGARGA